MTGIILNESYFVCPSCTTPHHLFGAPDAFRATASRLGIDILAELPLVQGVSTSGDAGVPYSLAPEALKKADGLGGVQWGEGMAAAAKNVWRALE